jgi:hypothetical protein
MMKGSLVISYVATLILCLAVLYLSNKVQTVENRQALILEEINDLKKKDRITSQDVDSIYRLMTRGIEDGAVQLHTKDEN